MTTDATAPWLIVGLGNPGPEYAMNRHNVGFMVADLLAERIGGKFKRAGKAQAQVLEGRIGAPGPQNRRVILAKPMSFMNVSGGPVTGLRDFYKVPVGNIVAIHDELDIDYGTMRLKLGGGDNGHNGLKSITKSMGADYHRVRFGIGRPPGRMQVADFVLKDFSSTERKELDYLVDRAADSVECLVTEGLERAQSAYNS
ncbi:aminoacyl-tRNA hydrolase [Streptomyces sp. NPDC056121]|jgi:PTH1 family peptidyl-tRNA hydrolase|uniref:Peptidyl-tRNA hydrolase n=1 Tax=Streptomyces aureus TaxID=193461 RepID=A0ABV4STJ0_9ACTN|nr:MULTISPECIES: aminoacyl-tRNA hydrolase [Streptomyces]WSE15517.1 aminoacyl-tRNA hydrolase [Streptomyces sp. NBC_01397]WSW26590.1 aminoacyl-tRNA hydrolase [Streptomyces sp. NBC_01003]MCX5082239.1 aminoacyl-tRNA hydrolase [Streptomyces sp. NBC_00401]MCX5437847.1 aminoacyl-tRNA hydrolase [Streptomyces sp. NBC_00063]UDM00421.1 aminoacyl-tRNA hydrolase [Streptomyces longhuiensis]